MRKRSSQPYGWDRAANGTIKHFYCANHDYDYYPKAWMAPDGRMFEEGYYDENGRHYGNMVMAGGTTMLKCDYCGNRMVYRWAEGDLPVCDKCGAQFKIDITDKEKKESAPAGGKSSIIVFLICLLLPIFIAIGAASFIVVRKAADRMKTETSSVRNSIYVEEIGRTCYLDGEDWYDSQTECWFYFNDTVSPDQWQYWYEGISSDYGDYGWMEYDMGEGAWYIEASKGNWVHLPADYDTSKLWHMTDETVNAYE